VSRYVLAGSSGLIGSALRAALHADGHDVVRLVRREPSAADERPWNPAVGEVDGALLDGVDGVVCLSGVGVGDQRWTDAHKRAIIQSRVDSVGTIARAMAAHGGNVLVSASAVGYYGDTGDRTVDEDAPAGDTFLSEVCVQWEAAADPARAAGIRVAHPRSGLVLAKDGGLLKRLSSIVRAGIGGRLGDGRQFLPWISLTDEVAGIRFLLEHDVAGPVNLTGPAPVRNAEFTRVLGRLLHRPTVLPVPAFAARAALGEFAIEVLIGQRAMPARLRDAGFEFRHADLESALRAELG
jgi:uncharacterized protein